MNKGLRLTETWMRRALWLVAFMFAGFLIGLGSQVIDNLAYLEPMPSAEALVDPVKSAALQEERAAHMQSQKLAHERESALLAQITGMRTHT